MKDAREKKAMPEQDLERRGKSSPRAGGERAIGETHLLPELKRKLKIRVSLQISLCIFL